MARIERLGWPFLPAAWTAGAIAVLLSLAAALGQPALAERLPYTIAVHLSTNEPPATGPEEVETIRELIMRRVEILNAAGGIKGHPIRIAFYDDTSIAQRTIANIDQTLADPRLIAILGIWSSTRGAEVVDRIGHSRVPFISERSLLVWRPAGEPGSLLAPIQYVRSGGEITRVPVLYIHLDMVRIHRVDSNEKSFEAELFFTTRSDREVPIGDIELTNAFRGTGNAAPLISMREVHQDRAGGFAAAGTRIYKVSGRFMFEPDLRKYPFDHQVLSISFQPPRTSQAFFIQPPSEAVRRQDFQVDGWRIESHYVGTNELIIRSVAGPLSEERIIPYYNFNYTWVMKRQVIDYMLRVVVPLSFIIIVAYLAIFIPRSELEAIMAIQVTALLSAIALSLALNQPSADDATLSDKIFVVAYATISVMIALSTFEVNEVLSKSRGTMRLVHVLQTYLVPVAATGLISYVLISASSEDPVLEALHDTWKRVVASATRG